MQQLQYQLKSIEEAEIVAEAISSQFNDTERDLQHKKVMNEITHFPMHYDWNCSKKMDIQLVRNRLEEEFGVENSIQIEKIFTVKSALKRSKKVRNLVISATGLVAGLLGVIGFIFK